MNITPARSFSRLGAVSGQAGAVALPGLTSVPVLPPDEGASPGDGVFFGERGGRPAMMSLI
ncbi:hypothetical protein PSAC2689_30055 [Paraburkholderia sacchari]